VSILQISWPAFKFNPNKTIVSIKFFNAFSTSFVKGIATNVAIFSPASFMLKLLLSGTSNPGAPEYLL
jgi:hypothetical protein